MNKKEIAGHLALNKLAEQNGIVIFGGSADTRIPLGELEQAFELDAKVYNRSISDLSVSAAIELYDTCVAPLCPETVLLHIGAADMEAFATAPADFDRNYRELIAHIKALDKKCRIAIISHKNESSDATVAEMNRHLKYIADAEQCEFGDIEAPRVWNPKETKAVVSFIHSIGFTRPLSVRRPIYDLVKILFCYDPSCAV